MNKKDVQRIFATNEKVYCLSNNKICRVTIPPTYLHPNRCKGDISLAVEGQRWYRTYRAFYYHAITVNDVDRGRNLCGLYTSKAIAKEALVKGLEALRALRSEEVKKLTKFLKNARRVRV